MLVSHWMKGAAILLYMGAILFVVTQCNRLLEPARSGPADRSHPDDEIVRTIPKPPLLKQAEERTKKRQTRERELAEQRAQHHLMEAHLATMVQEDIPAAVDELASAAVGFLRKLPDLKHLKKADQWAREAPVKDALARARAVTREWYGLDREAQKGREEPTLHAASDINTLTKRIEGLKRGGEGIAEFARALPVLYPSVPETLMVSAIDAIARAALPADAFDPCRDPTACPKPPPPAPPPTILGSALSPSVEAPPAKTPTFCVRVSASSRDLKVFEQPDATASVIARLRSGQCGIAPTGFVDSYMSPWGPTAWEEIVVGRREGWVRAGLLVPQRTEPLQASPSRIRRSN